MDTKGGQIRHEAGVETLCLSLSRPVEAWQGGLFVSIGEGTHPTRVIDSFELIFVSKGRLAMFEEDRTFELNEGQCLLLWAGRRHGGARPYDKDLSFYWIHFMPPKGRSPVGGAFSFCTPQVAAPARPEYLSTLFRRFLDDRERGVKSVIGDSLMVMQMLFEASLSRSQAGGNEAGQALAGRIQGFIDEHNTEPIATSDIARAMGYNEDYLGRVFTHTTGRTITQAIHLSRLRLAKRLLQGNAMNINQVAMHSGFNDPHYFRRLFRRYEGLTPAAFRKLYARAHINRY
ncbi:MAG: AraC family transcriptional regulator [Planctomycetes bacterium]|jgi:AraC-like DNA-binding protein|nr:AraC family transcriptional regulator [Planctomycetota bacterium]